MAVPGRIGLETLLVINGPINLLCGHRTFLRIPWETMAATVPWKKYKTRK
jgi:hypothetical protein